MVVDGSAPSMERGQPPARRGGIVPGVSTSPSATLGVQGSLHHLLRPPRLVEGRDLYEQTKYAESYNECANTNVQAVFDLILRTAVKNRLAGRPAATLYFISDMEFDSCAEHAI